MSRRIPALFLLAAAAGCIQVLPAGGESREGSARRAPANEVATVEHVGYAAAPAEEDFAQPVEIVAVEAGEAQECCESEKPGEACCQEGAAPEAKPAEAKADAQKLDDLAHAQRDAERRVKRAITEMERSKVEQAFAVEKATQELDDARKALRHFEGFEKPTRLAKAELELKDAHDYLTEQDEEMRQLELLYEKDDLGDKTKEIVLSRGRRRHERAQQRLELAKRDFEDLRGFQLEQQRRGLDRALGAKERDLQRAQWTAETTGEDKQQAIEEAQRALAKARRELQKAGGGDRESLEKLGYVNETK